MLLGKDDVILNVAPAYVTDALVRKVNVDRYDDREVIKTNLFKYSKYYSGKIPEFIEGDIFRIIVPLDDSYSYDFGKGESKNADKVPIKIQIKGLSD